MTIPLTIQNEDNSLTVEVDNFDPVLANTSITVNVTDSTGENVTDSTGANITAVIDWSDAQTERLTVEQEDYQLTVESET